jgi:TAP-like protein
MIWMMCVLRWAISKSISLEALTARVPHSCIVARYLPNSVHIVVPDGGHGLGGLEGIDCLYRLLTAFVEEGTAKALDTSCVKAIRRRGFTVQ